MKILLVDDSVMQQKIAKIYLGDGAENSVISAVTAAEALRMVNENSPEFIILDVDLPDGNGMDVLKAIKASPRSAAVPVIMCTAQKKFAQEEFVAAGAAGYITKPHGFKALRETIDSIVASKKNSAL